MNWLRKRSLTFAPVRLASFEAHGVETLLAMPGSIAGGNKTLACRGVHWFWIGTHGEYDKLIG